MTADKMLENLAELKRLSREYLMCVARGDKKGARKCIEEMSAIQLYNVEDDNSEN